jgi:hypothetical protein
MNLANIARGLVIGLVLLTVAGWVVGERELRPMSCLTPPEPTSTKHLALRKPSRCQRDPPVTIGRSMADAAAWCRKGKNDPQASGPHQ